MNHCELCCIPCGTRFPSEHMSHLIIDWEAKPAFTFRNNARMRICVCCYTAHVSFYNTLRTCVWLYQSLTGVEVDPYGYL